MGGLLPARNLRDRGRGEECYWRGGSAPCVWPLGKPFTYDQSDYSVVPHEDPGERE